jgi:tRNA(Ile)-lysidine synthase
MIYFRDRKIERYPGETGEAMAGQQRAMAWDRSLLRPGERVCVAVSGGADSTALLLALAEANAGLFQPEKAPLGIVLTAAHVHHGLRGAEADADEAFLRELCDCLRVPLTVFRVDTAARQAAEGEGLEEAARELRYQALGGLMASGAVDVVATAHTLDDQAETVVMKLLRGAWTEGLGGISPVKQEPGNSKQETGTAGKIVRPLLCVRRAEVEAYLRERGQPWRDDSSNLDLSLTRNRVRHQLMPLLREFNPAVETSLAAMAAIARDEEAFWQAEVARVLPQVVLPGRPVRGGGRAVGTAVGDWSGSIEIARLAAMPSALRRRVVRALAAAAGLRLTAEETTKVLALAGLAPAGAPCAAGITGRVGSKLELRSGLRVERSARELRLWRQGS